MSISLCLLPILLFVGIFVGSGLYFSTLGVDQAFYQISPVVAIIPAIALGWFLHKGETEQKMHDFLDGARHRDIITMCIIFLLAGAFSEVTKEIGSVDAAVNFAISFVPSQYLVISVFAVSAFIATSIGTSLGTIATMAPIAAVLAGQAGLSPALMAATVVGGAMFGDNLSVVSDTTIAAVMSQEADMKNKLRLNAKIALVTSILTLVVLALQPSKQVVLEAKEYSLVLISPYIILLALAAIGVNVFVSLCASIAFAVGVGLITHEHVTVLTLSQSLTKGFAGMQGIMLLSLMVGGLSGLAGKHAMKELAERLSSWIAQKNAGKILPQLVIAKLVSIFDLLLANNTIAIIFSGEVAREIAKKHKIPAHYSAAWLDIFSCVFQGLIPYGAQILLVSTLVGVSPLSVVPHVYYCYFLGLVSVAYIFFVKIDKQTH